MTEHCKASILIIEDDPDQVLLYSKALRKYHLTSVASGTAAISLMAQEIPDLIILDQILAQGEKGADFLPLLRTEFAHVPVLIISGTLDIRSQLKALQGPFAAHYVIEKPVDVDELIATVERALEECGIAETVRSLRSLERAEMVKTNEPERQFAARLARQHELVKRMRHGSGGPPTVSALAQEFKVSRRTIARDLQDLIHRGQIDAAIYSHTDGADQ